MGGCKKKRCHNSESSKKNDIPARKRFGASQAGECAVEDDDSFKVAIPLTGGALSSHLGLCEQFAVISVEDAEIQRKDLLAPPFREIEILPRWLDSLQVSLMIAGAMSKRAFGLFTRRSIDVITGAPCLPPEDLVLKYLAGALVMEAHPREDWDDDLPHGV